MSDVQIYRRRDSAKVLGCSETQILKFERQGLLTSVLLPGIRRRGNDAAEVHELARTLIAQAKERRASA